MNNTNLPTPASSFLGRESELQKADALLSRHRLLTVSGPGGAGKTRFAIELASRQLARFPNGVFWVSLVALRDPELVLETIAQTLGARSGLPEHIGSRRMLLLLDNLEQVIEAAPRLSKLVATCEQLTMLVTSRELMRVEGEVEFSLPPLAQHESVELFCERAQSARTTEVEELCRRLDGLPLAIELAAARMPVFTPAQLLERLGARLDLLKGRRDAEPRQRTLRATIAWSYDLLPNGEAKLFRRLGMFAGGWTLEAAETAADANADALQSLVEKSLVRHSGDRFWMLETVREFALDQLEAAGEAPAARAAYCDWMRRCAEQAGPELIGHNQNLWLGRLDDEYANIREVITLALAAEDSMLALEILTAIDRYWILRPVEAIAWLERGLDLRDRVPPPLAADALRVTGQTAFHAGEPKLALRRFREALAQYEVLGDESGIAKIYRRIAVCLAVAGQLDEAEELLDQATTFHRRFGDRWELAMDVHVAGNLSLLRGDLSAAGALLESSVELLREVGDLSVASGSLVDLAQMAVKAEDFERAVEFARESLELSWAQRDLINLGIGFGWLARAVSGLGDVRGAAIFWGVGERLDDELGQTMWRLQKKDVEAGLASAVVADEEGIAAGRALATAEAVKLALRNPRRSASTPSETPAERPEFSHFFDQ